MVIAKEEIRIFREARFHDHELKLLVHGVYSGVEELVTFSNMICEASRA